MIDSLQQGIESEMPNQLTRWGGTMENWHNHMDVLRLFAENRPTYMNLHLIYHFGIEAMELITLNNVHPEMGKIRINTLAIDSFPWTGYYYRNIPVSLTALPEPGYRFVGWNGTVNSETAQVTVPMSEYSNITALFEMNGNDTPNIVINEINYNAADAFNPGDWVELYNNGESEVDLTGWQFLDSDDTHIFVIPENTVLQPGEYLVICENSSDFSSLFPEVENYIGDTGFGLSGSGELIRLYDNLHQMMDSLVYDDNDPWPAEPDGNGPTLSLKNPDLDNSLGENWAASLSHGTPGQVNDVLAVRDNDPLNLIPEHFGLGQNYPNPFNPDTRISFQLPKSSRVILTVYDMLGRKIATIKNELLPAGYHGVVWKPSDDLASGIYFYQIKTDHFPTMSRKMLYLK